LTLTAFFITVGKLADAARFEEVNICSVGGGLNQILVKRFNFLS
jgi:hypothetical protein